VSVETAISIPRTQVRISQLDWLNSDGEFTVTFLEPDSSELSDVVAAFFGGADARSCSWEHTANAAILGLNDLTLTDVTVDQCKEECCGNPQCKSFDYVKNDNKCYLSFSSASDVGGLKTDYSDNPYDHYSISRAGPFFYLKASSTETPVIAFGAAVELYVLDTKLEASVTGSFDERGLTASFSARLPEVRLPDWMTLPDTFDGALGWIDIDDNVFDNSGHFVKNAATGGTNMILNGAELAADKTKETVDWIASHFGRRRLVDPSRRRLTDPYDSSTWVAYGIEVSWEGTISADMLV